MIELAGNPFAERRAERIYDSNKLGAELGIANEIINVTGTVSVVAHQTDKLLPIRQQP